MDYIANGPEKRKMRMVTLKLMISVALILGGISFGLVLTQEEKSAERGVVTLDFGDYRIENADVNENENATEALISLCQSHGYQIIYNPDGTVKTIDGYPKSDDDRTWGLYVTNSKKGGAWEKYVGSPSGLKLPSAESISWGLCSENERPTPVIDATGHVFYGSAEAKTIVSLAPSCTETVCRLGYEDRIVGTDSYSNYPVSVVGKRESGAVADVGNFVSPNFEIIVKLNPDLVIGISGQAEHIVLAEKLRAVGINTVITSGGEDLQTVYDNTYMCGTAIGDSEKTREITLNLRDQVEKTYGYVSSVEQHPNIMTAITVDKSPWVAGIDTYVSDIYGKIGACNAFDESVNPGIGGTVEDWKSVNSEVVVRADPEYIFVVNSEMTYESLMDKIPEEWKSTSAYKNGNVYLLKDSAEDLMSRPSTRLAQAAELLGRIVHPEAFPESVEIAKEIGDDYAKYLRYSTEL